LFGSSTRQVVLMMELNFPNANERFRDTHWLVCSCGPEMKGIRDLGKGGMAGCTEGITLVGLFIYVGVLVIMVASIATLLDETRLRCLWSVLIVLSWQRQLLNTTVLLNNTVSGEAPV
jgi:hypothetical protein